jgi:hypothetical protein
MTKTTKTAIAAGIAAAVVLAGYFGFEVCAPCPVCPDAAAPAPAPASSE